MKLKHYSFPIYRLIEHDLSKNFIEYISVRNLIPILTFLISIFIALLNPLFAMISWSSMFVTFPLVKMRYKKKKYADTDEKISKTDH